MALGRELSVGDEQRLFTDLTDQQTRISTARGQALANPRLATAAATVQRAGPDAGIGVKFALIQALSKGAIDSAKAVEAATVAGLHQKSNWERLRADLDPRNAAKGVSRSVFAGLNFPLQMVQSAAAAGQQYNLPLYGIETVSSALTHGKIGHPYWAPKPGTEGAPSLNPVDWVMSTNAGQMARTVATRGELGGGTGFFPGGAQEVRREDAAKRFRGTVPGTEVVDQRATQAEYERTGVKSPIFVPGSGQTATASRLFMSTVVEPGSMAYRVGSGIGDFALAWYGDPAAIYLHSVQAGRAAAKVLNPAAALAVEDIAKALRPGEKIVTRLPSAEGEKAVQGVFRSAAPEALTQIGPTGTAERVLAAPPRTTSEFIPMAQIEEDARAIRRAEAGVVEYGRGTALSQNTENFLQTENGKFMSESVAADKQFSSINNAFHRKLAPAVVLRLQDASTPAEVNQILYEVMGSSLRTTADIRITAAPKWYDKVPYAGGFVDTVGEKTGITALHARFEQHVASSRLYSQLPKMRINVDPMVSDLEKIQNIDNLDAALRNMKIGYEAVEGRTAAQNAFHVRSQLLERYARGIEDNSQDVFGATKVGLRMMEEIMHGYMEKRPLFSISAEKRALRRAAGHDFIHELATWTDPMKASIYGSNAQGIGTDFTSIAPTSVERLVEGAWQIDDAVTAGIRSLGPQLTSEGIATSIPIPDPRVVRRMTSRLGWMTSNEYGKIRVPFAVVEWAQNNVWKPLAIIRPAFMLRVIGDEQMRMAGSGLVSAVMHPFHWISWAMHHSGAFEAHGRDFSALEELAGDGRTHDAFLMSQHNTLAGGSQSVYVEPLAAEKRAYHTHGFGIAEKAQNPRLYNLGADDEHRLLERDEIGQLIGQGKSNTEMVDWLQNPDPESAGARTYRQLIANGKTSVHYDDVAQEYVRAVRDYTDGAQLDDYLNTVRERIRVKTGNDPDLLSAIGHHTVGAEERVYRNEDLVPFGDPGPRVEDPFATKKDGTPKVSTWVGTQVRLKGSEAELGVGALVSPADRHNVGTVTGIAGDRVTVHFVSPEGVEATKEFASADLKIVSRAGKGAAKDLIGTIVADAEQPGHSIVSVGKASRDKMGKASPELQAALRRFTESEAAPTHYKYAVRVGEKTDGYRGEAAEVSSQARDWAVSGFFRNLYGRSSDWLSRSPTFRQFYWRRATEMSKYLTVEESNQFLKNIQSAAERHTGGDVAKLLGRDRAVGEAVANAKAIAENPALAGNLTVSQLDDYAKGWALEETNKLLYSASRRSNFFDITRIVFPFGEAWKEAVTSWGRIVAQNTATLQRAQVLIQGARGFDPDGNGQGFFHPDPVTGDEVFTYPGSREISRALTSANPLTAVGKHVPVLNRFVGTVPGGMPMDINGKVQGLNIGMQILPSIGPVVQYPVAFLTNNKPQLQWVRSILLPYGAPQGGLQEEVTPAWMGKIASALTGHEGDRLYGDTFSRVWQVLAASGEYGTDGEEQTRLRNDAAAQARALTLFRGIAQSIGPASGPVEFYGDTAKGDKSVGVLLNEWHRLQADNPNNAVEEWVNLYGEDALAYTISKTRSTIGGLDASKSFGQWEQDNPYVFHTFPLVAGYFGPTSTDYDLNVHDIQQQAGYNKRLTVDERMSALNQTVINRRYYALRDLVTASNLANGRQSMTSAQSRTLADFKAKLNDQYPVSSPMPRPDLPTIMTQLVHAVNDPRLADNPIAQDARTYLQFRTLVEAVARNRKGATTIAAADNTDIREALNAVGTNLAQKNPDFARLWQRVLVREVD